MGANCIQRKGLPPWRKTLGDPRALGMAVLRVFVWGMSELTVWCNAKLPERAMEALRVGVGGHRLVIAERVVNNVEPSHVDPRLPGAEVAFGQPDPGQIISLEQLKWVHLSSAGYGRYDRQDLRLALAKRGAKLSNSSAVYAEPTAQHAVAFVLAAARQLHAAWENQRSAKAWPAAELRGRSELLCGQSALLLGYGSIGRRVAELLGPLKMEITAVRRKVRGDEAVRVRPIEELSALLPGADHVINILPGGAATEKFFGAQKFAMMKKGAIFYNVGRGTTVDQAALRQALLKGQVAAAYLDVTDPEPLAAGDPLWTTANCFITPHTAGGAADEFDRVVRHFLENLARYAAGSELRDRVF
jgi:phosphoglycerate dehydrogenase-like enzyme